MKHYFWQNYETVSLPITQSLVVKGQSNISRDIQLPRLKHLAVSIPGPVCTLMGCITAPALEDLHLDGLRELRGDDDDEGPLYEWARWEKKLVYDVLKLLASRCPNVQRLAVTDAHLARTTWEWIMCGEDGRQPPFRKLKYITLRQVFGTLCPESHWGFNNELFEKFASKPMIPLKRLTLVDCDIPLNATNVVEAFRASGTKEFKYDSFKPQGMKDELRALEELGVSVTYGANFELRDSFDHESM